MQVLRSLPNQQSVHLNLSVSLGRGGEACVYTVPTDSNLVAKIYHHPTDSHARKLKAMLAHPPENPTASLGHVSIAWPDELLKASDGSDRIVGFLMPRIRGMRPIIDFYNPRTRRQHCPLFNYQYLLRTARNLAAAFAALHARGYCVGDVNESNILVSDTALVTLVDTDSFQVPDPEGDFVYRCPVGKPEFTPPELQNKVFADCDRAITHDLFGLGVLIFQLLMEGTHPFSGIYQGIGEPPPYEARIAAGHFTYSQKHRVPYKPTPVAPSWSVLHPALQELFIRCFEVGHSDPLQRPSAATWLLALGEVEEQLTTCEQNPQHRYSRHLDKCPWCERTVQLGGRDPFPSPQAIAAKEHLKPQKKSRSPRRRTVSPLPAPRPTPSPLPLRRLIYPQNFAPQAIPYYQPKKRRIYPFVFALIVFGLLGYVDLLIKLTNQPFNPVSTYARQMIQVGEEDKLSFDEYYKQGHAAYQIRDYAQAVEKFTKAIRKRPDYARAYVNRANAYYNLKEYEASLADYNQAIVLNPNEVKAYVNRGNVRIILAELRSDPDKLYKLAIQDFNHAIKLDDREIEAYIRRGIVRMQIARYSGESQVDYQKAIADFNEALKRGPSRAEAYFQRGMVRYHIAQYSSEFEAEYRRALQDFDRAVKINSQFARAYLKRGIVRYELSQYGGEESRKHSLKAIDDLQRAAKISLEQKDMDNYQQAINSICVVIENKCDAVINLINAVDKKISN